MVTSAGDTTRLRVLSRGTLFESDCRMEPRLADGQTDGRGASCLAGQSLGQRTGDDVRAARTDAGVAGSARGAEPTGRARKIASGHARRERGIMEHGSSARSVVPLRPLGTGSDLFRDGPRKSRQSVDSGFAIDNQRVLGHPGGRVVAADRLELS